ncbi:cysteine synthase B [Aeromonas hydrophila]|uniref:Cysteine synthase n=1 Tax=Aeromonas hydrophila TaxID=644 RepID=A0AAX3P9V0_AERHY|nr:MULTISPECIES: cysteine synthase CysM [Aeromonas]HDT5862349.1 cysteine synthase CysM [Aeromonas hydrophila subsp. hydrophila]MCV9380562.1 cysteine synthase CysM [Aeromonas hydrophila]MDD9227601.1 cysteine synthase CysM [Aeromonas hydrophila]ONG11165.1 cysteine synthase B [Aeromonas hydrophila]WEA28835.1 cysteine synthase CysM [Aeromonas hydrophila]
MDPIMAFATLEELIGNTPLLALRRINPHPGVTLLVKLEGNNPAGSVKDRPALNLIKCAEASGHLAPGARLIEATSGNTGIALAMVAAARGYRMRLIMPNTMSQERRDAMQAYGAELVLVEGGMEAARDLALAMQARGEGLVLDQFNNLANPDAHYLSTGPEIWRQSEGAVTHFVSAMGTTGTIMGVSRYLKEQNPAVQVIGLQPAEGSQIPGIRRWPAAYLPAIFEPARVDRVLDVTQQEALAMMRRLAREEGICCGVSSGGAVAGALRVAAEIKQGVVVAIICDRGDRYLSTGVFSDEQV